MTYRLHSVLERLSVLGFVDRFGIRAEQLYTVLLQKSALRKLHRERQRGLSAQIRHNAVGLFNLDNALYYVQSQRLYVYLVRHMLVRHYRRGVGVDKHDFQTLLFERAASLRTRVVKLGCLSYNDRSAAYYQNLFYITS